jgi:hypothetical protein
MWCAASGGCWAGGGGEVAGAVRSGRRGALPLSEPHPAKGRWAFGNRFWVLGAAGGRENRMTALPVAMPGIPLPLSWDRLGLCRSNVFGAFGGGPAKVRRGRHRSLRCDPAGRRRPLRFGDGRASPRMRRTPRARWPDSESGTLAQAAHRPAGASRRGRDATCRSTGGNPPDSASLAAKAGLGRRRVQRDPAGSTHTPHPALEHAAFALNRDSETCWNMIQTLGWAKEAGLDAPLLRGFA